MRHKRPVKRRSTDHMQLTGCFVNVDLPFGRASISKRRGEPARGGLARRGRELDLGGLLDLDGKDGVWWLTGATPPVIPSNSSEKALESQAGGL